MNYLFLTLGLIVGIWGGIVLVSPKESSSNPFNLPGDPTTTRSFEEYGDYDCSDFSYHSEAQEFYEESINELGYDYHELDRNNDGVACESLQ